MFYYSTIREQFNKTDSQQEHTPYNTTTEGIPNYINTQSNEHNNNNDNNMNTLIVEGVYGVRPDKHTGGREYLVKWHNAGHIRDEYVPQSKQNQIPFLAEAIAEFHRRYPRQPYGLPCVRTEWSLVEHVIARKDDLVLVKWRGLGYDQTTWESLASLPPLPDLPPPPSSSSFPTEAFLLPHQRMWYDKLLNAWRSSQGQILAHGSGTGKRVAVAMFIDSIIKAQAEDTENGGIALVVVPYETLADWKFVFETFVPQLKIMKYTGNTIARHVIRRHYRDKVDILLTSFKIAQNDVFLENTSWTSVITESINNNTADTIYQLRQEFFTQNHVVVITNSMQHENSKIELLSRVTYPIEADHKMNAEQIKSQHISKQDISGKLPLLQVSLNMSPIQRSCYTALLNRAKPLLNDVNHPVCFTHRQDLMYTIAQLVQCAQHPFALFNNQPKIESIDSHQTDALMQGSAKLLAINSILHAAHKTSLGVAVVCRSTRTLDILEEFLLQQAEYTSSRVDISASIQKRKSSIKAFIHSTEDCLLIPSHPVPKMSSMANPNENENENENASVDEYSSSNRRKLVVVLFDDNWSLYTGIEHQHCHAVLRLVNIDTIEKTLLDHSEEATENTFLRYLRSFVSCVPIEKLLREKAVHSVWHGKRKMSVSSWSNVTEQIYLSEKWIQSVVSEVSSAATVGDYPHPLVHQTANQPSPIPTDHSNFWELLLRQTNNIEPHTGWKEGEELSKILDSSRYKVEDPCTCLTPYQEIQHFMDAVAPDSNNFISPENRQAAVQFVVAHGLDQRGIESHLIPSPAFSEPVKTVSYLKKLISEIIRTDYSSAVMERIGFLHAAVNAVLEPELNIELNDYSRWTSEHDFILLHAILYCGYGNWEQIAKYLAKSIPSEHLDTNCFVLGQIGNIRSRLESGSTSIPLSEYPGLILILKERLEGIQRFLNEYYWKKDPLPSVKPFAPPPPQNNSNPSQNNNNNQINVNNSLRPSSIMTRPNKKISRFPSSSELNPSRPAWTFSTGSSRKKNSSNVNLRTFRSRSHSRQPSPVINPSSSSQQSVNHSSPTPQQPQQMRTESSRTLDGKVLSVKNSNPSSSSSSSSSGDSR